MIKTTKIIGALAVVGMLVGAVGIAGVAYAQVPTLSTTSVTVGVGQSISITAENGVDAYVGSNPASNIVSASVNGTQITLTGVAPGSATLSMCGVGTASDCTNLYVTVQATAVTSVSFSPSSLSLAIGAEQSVTISGGNGSYTISSNSNASVASTNLSGNSLAVTGLESGTNTITVCDTSNTNTCGTLSVTVGSSSSSGLTFGANNLSLAPGSNQTISISGGNGAYNISTNANPSVASVGMSNGNSIVVDALTSGTDTITVCDTSNTNTCGTLSVTVTGSSSGSTSTGPVSFSVASPTVAVGQNLNVTLSGGATTYVVLTNATANVAAASVSGNLLSITGESGGTDLLTICAVAGGCSSYTVTVTGSGMSTAPSTSSGQATPTVIPTATVTPTVTTTVPSTVVANSSLLAEIQTLQAAVMQTLNEIESIQTQLNQVEAQVNAGAGGSVSASEGVGGVSANSGSAYNFTELLTVGSEDAQVTALQQRLTDLGFYSGPVTGYYGSLTEDAVMKYQTAHGLTATGSVGPATRADLNAGD